MNSQEVHHLIRYIEEFDDENALATYLALAWIVFTNQKSSDKNYRHPAYFRKLEMAMEYAELLGQKIAHEIYDLDMTQPDLANVMVWEADDNGGVICRWYGPVDPYPAFGTVGYDDFVPKFAIGISSVVFKG